MVKLYAEFDENEYIINITSSLIASNYVEVISKEDKIDIAKLQGYVLKPEDTINYIEYNQAKYDEYIAKVNKEKAIEEGEKLLDELSNDSVLDTASDEDAYIMRYLYDEWKPDIAYKTGNRKLFKDNLYKCKQNHTSEAQYTPDLIPALWDIINGNSEKGTIDNPIPIPELFSSMEYEKGKYYIEDGVIYLMNRQGMEDGEKVSLTFKPSALIGQYFEVVEK